MSLKWFSAHFSLIYLIPQFNITQSADRWAAAHWWAAERRRWAANLAKWVGENSLEFRHVLIFIITF